MEGEEEEEEEEVDGGGEEEEEEGVGLGFAAVLVKMDACFCFFKGCCSSFSSLVSTSMPSSWSLIVPEAVRSSRGRQMRAAMQTSASVGGVRVAQLTHDVIIGVAVATTRM